MFNSANSLLEYVDIRKVLPLYDQQSLFAKYTGIYPELNKSYYSLFRTDRKPGCRFKWHSGILYFVENVGFQGKLFFSIVDVISILQGVDVKTAIHKIIRNDTIGGSTWEKINLEHSNNVKPEIRFKYTEWEKDNYFRLSPDILMSENVYKVTDYWIGINGSFKYNSVHNPKQTLCIAYYFPESNTTKLYFPEKKEFKWYTNCMDEVFGEQKLDYYLNRNPELIIITKSQKDRLILDYKYGYNAVAPQNEGIDFGHVVSKLKLFNRQILLFDNDVAGQKYAIKYSEKYNIPWTNIEIAKDVFEADTKYNNLKNYLEYVFM
jgi:hypothetical protein